MSGQEREMEEDEGEGTSDTALMLPRRPPDCQAAALRSPRWAGLAAQGLGILLLPGRALAGLLLHLLLPAAVFLLVLLPAAAIVFLGFLCHSRACQESGAETRATEEKVSPAGGTYWRAYKVRCQHRRDPWETERGGRRRSGTGELSSEAPLKGLLLGHLPLGPSPPIFCSEMPGPPRVPATGLRQNSGPALSPGPSLVHLPPTPAPPLESGLNAPPVHLLPGTASRPHPSLSAPPQSRQARSRN
ncbi:transmembrane protein 88B isoform X1 [Camelus ferus]|uniref:Transmembrane protein 88B isoform X1 n=1 Tax=Camelus ferus TaxID=419612 RepID=A0A8B8U896_CAMFR|nr:transmembrane protein 88B isoform X1 [Camelus ferus]